MLQAADLLTTAVGVGSGTASEEWVVSVAFLDAGLAMLHARLVSVTSEAFPDLDVFRDEVQAVTEQVLARLRTVYSL